MLNSTQSTLASKASISNAVLLSKNWLYKICIVLTAFLFVSTQVSLAQTPVPMGSQPGLTYTENFADIANWTNNFAAGVGASRWGSVAINASGTIPDGVKTTVSTATFAITTSGGVQKGTGNIIQLSTGATSNTSANAIDLFLNFTGVNAGTLSFDWATVFNGTGDRLSSLKIYTSTDGISFTELTGAAVLNKANNVTASGSITTVALPASFNNSATARIRFYEYNGATAGTTGSRAKISIDNVNVTAVASNYSVTYNGNGNTGGSVPVDASSPYSSGATVTVKANTGSLLKTGNTFTGWNTAANGSGTSYAATGSVTFTMPSNAVTLFAQWQINTYTVTYNGNTNDGGTAPVDGSSPYNYNSNVTVLGAGTLTKTGFTFNGWNTVANGSGTAYAAGATITGIAANTTLFAQWIAANTYSIIYDGNSNTGGSAPVDGSSPYTAGSNVTVLGAGTLVKTGYTFSGWNTAANGGGTAYSPGGTISSIAANTILYAQWVINTYTVIYNGNGSDGGSVPVDPSSPYNYNSNVTVLGAGTLTRTNYNFTGWNTAANGSGTAYAAGGTITGIAANTILYAQWTIITYTVTYNGNTNTGGTAPVDGSSPYAVGSNVTVLAAGTLVKTGNTFAGWNTLANGTGTAYSAGGTITSIAANTTLFARWTINTYTVTYDGNGNTGGTAPVDNLSPYNFGATVTVLANTGSLVKTGATFVGWNTAADGTGTSYAPAATFTLGAANVLLYAKWAVPLYEGFSYIAGGNVGGSTNAAGTTNNNWTTHSNSLVGTINVVSGSLNYTGLLASTGNRISLPGSNATVPRDINRSAGLIPSQNVTYYSFLLNVTDATQLATTFGTAGNGYFVHLCASSGTTTGSFSAKVYIRSSNTAANFRLGISESGNTPVETTGDLSFGNTYLVVVKYVFNNTAGNDLATMWVNPSSLGSTEPAGGVNGPGSVNLAGYNSANTGFCIRNASATPKADIDEIRVGTTWASVTPPVTHQLTTTVGTGGTVTAPATSPTTVNQGAATTITALANSGFAFSGWTVEAGSASIVNAALANTTVTLNTVDATVKANFVATSFTITASAIGGGSISPVGSVTVNSGGSQTFTITPDACNDIAEVIIDGTTSLGIVTSYTFTNVTASHTIDAYFNPSTSTTWTGAVSTNWDNVSNWSSCLPNGTLDVVIAAPGGTVLFQPVLNVDAAVNGLTINDGATFLLNGKTLTINGGFTGSAASTLTGSDASSLVLNSTTTLISSVAIRLHSLVINGGTTTLSSAVEISSGTATVSPGEVLVPTGSQLVTNGFLTIKSNQFGTARVAAGALAGNYITGDVTVERYIPNNGFRSWRLLSVPTFGSGQTIRQSWQDNGSSTAIPTGFGTQITGPGLLVNVQLAGLDDVSQKATLLTWTGSAWAGVSNTNTAISNFKSYFLYVRGERSKGVTGYTTNSSATTLQTKGTLYQGDGLATPSIAANSFGLVGNLYPSAIDFEKIKLAGGLGGGVKDLFYIWDSKKLTSSLGVYQTFNSTNGYLCPISGGSYTQGVKNVAIESGQAFFVETGASAGTVTLSEGVKISGTSGTLGLRPTTPASALVKIDSRLYLASGEMADANVVVFDNAYPNAVSNEDASKLSNSGENFAIQKTNKILAIEGRQVINNSDTIFFSMWNMKPQTYKLEFVPANIGNTALGAELEDAYLHTSVPVSLDVNTAVNFTVDANAGSFAANRFRLVFRPSAPLPVSFISISANRTNGTVKVDWKVAAERNIRNYEVERSLNGISFTMVAVIAANGNNSSADVIYTMTDAAAPATAVYYRVKSNAVSGEIKYSSIVKVNAGNVKPGFAISPNPSEGGVVNLQFTNQPEGRYSVKIVSTLGQTLLNNTLTHAGGSSTQLLNLPEGIARGTYQVIIIAPDNTRITQKLLVNNN